MLDEGELNLFLEIALQVCKFTCHGPLINGYKRTPVSGKHFKEHRPGRERPEAH